MSDDRCAAGDTLTALAVVATLAASALAGAIIGWVVWRR